jgi:hypothetical protein
MRQVLGARRERVRHGVATPRTAQVDLMPSLCVPLQVPTVTNMRVEAGVTGVPTLQHLLSDKRAIAVFAHKCARGGVVGRMLGVHVPFEQTLFRECTRTLSTRILLHTVVIQLVAFQFR